MTIPYNKRREYRLKLAEQLPPALRGKIPLRSIETFAALPDQARQKLEKAVLAGLTQIPIAIRSLKDNPRLSAEELLAETPIETPAEAPTETPEASETPDPSATLPGLAATVRAANNGGISEAILRTPLRDGNADIETLAAVIRSRFQSMPEIAARALAQSPPMEDVLNVQVAFRKAIESPHIRSDFVSATLWSLLQSSLAQLEALSTPNTVRAANTGGTPVRDGSLSLRLPAQAGQGAGHPDN